MGTKFENAGNRITDVGKKISVASAAVTTMGVASVKTAADFEISNEPSSGYNGYYQRFYV